MQHQVVLATYNHVPKKKEPGWLLSLNIRVISYFLAKFEAGNTRRNVQARLALNTDRL